MRCTLVWAGEVKELGCEQWRRCCSVYCKVVGSCWFCDAGDSAVPTMLQAPVWNVGARMAVVASQARGWRPWRSQTVRLLQQSLGLCRAPFALTAHADFQNLHLILKLLASGKASSLLVYKRKDVESGSLSLMVCQTACIMQSGGRSRLAILLKYCRASAKVC